MAVLKMQKISICALKKDRKAILEQLQHLGVLEVDREKEEDAFFQKMDTTGQRMKFEKAATAADQALGILDAYAPEKKSLLSSLEGRTDRSRVGRKGSDIWTRIDQDSPRNL